MPAANPLNEIGQVDDCFLKLGRLVIFGGSSDGLCILAQSWIAESFGIVAQDPRELGNLCVASDQLGILDGIDPFGEGDHKAIEFVGQLGHVFLGRSNGRFSLKHGSAVIGLCPSKLERDLQLG